MSAQGLTICKGGLFHAKAVSQPGSVIVHQAISGPGRMFARIGARAVGRIARSAGPPGIDRYRDQERSTKAGQARRSSIEPELLPLLRVMHDDAGRKGRVVEHMPEGRSSPIASVSTWSVPASRGPTCSRTTERESSSRPTTCARRASPGWPCAGRPAQAQEPGRPHVVHDDRALHPRAPNRCATAPAKCFLHYRPSWSFRSTNRRAKQLGLAEDHNILSVSLVGHEGLEPSANGLRVHCSTN